MTEQANKGGILSLSVEMFEILQQKHSKVSKGSDDILIQEKPQEVHPVIYESINSEVVKDAIKKTRRATVPSGMKTYRWHHILISGNCSNVGEDLCKSTSRKKRKLSCCLPSMQINST